MDNAEKIMDEVVELARELTQAKRQNNLSRFKSIAALLGLAPEQFDYLKHNVAQWPDRLSRGSTELRYLVDFGHGDQPDYSNYLATFDEVAKLLRYTPGSCKVAFNSSPNRQVDRRRRPTKLGPCIITRLPEALSPSLAIDHGAKRLSERDSIVNPVNKGAARHAKGNKY